MSALSLGGSRGTLYSFCVFHLRCIWDNQTLSEYLGTGSGCLRKYTGENGVPWICTGCLFCSYRDLQTSPETSEQLQDHVCNLGILCIYIYIHTYIHIHIYMYTYIRYIVPSYSSGDGRSCTEGHIAHTVGFHNFNLRNFNLRVSNPSKLIVDAFLTRCRISMCQSLGPKKHDEISEIDRIERTDLSSNPIWIWCLIERTDLVLMSNRKNGFVLIERRQIKVIK